MSFFDRPNWYGEPVLIKDNTRSFLRAVGLILGAALILSVAYGVALALGPKGDSRQGIITPLQVFFGASAIFSLVIGWFVAVFFFFRILINAIRMHFHTAEGFSRWSRKALYTPFYGFRQQDLSTAGIRYRRLAIEGIVGFVLVNGFIWALVIASELVGLDLV
ncbi:MAG: hypothetical protein QNJ05_11990 [Woeseiaceae bacterium]|nr:hypothetical protein [Woeseiaceae bacterium]